LSLAGCVIPIHYPAGYTQSSRAHLDHHAIESLNPGTTTRASMRSALGEPDAKAADDGWWSYRSMFRPGGVEVGILAPGGTAFRTSDQVELRQLVARFDSSGILTAKEYETRICTPEPEQSPYDPMLCFSNGPIESQAAQQVLPTDERMQQVIPYVFWYGEVHGAIARTKRVMKGLVPEGDLVLSDRSFVFSSDMIADGGTPAGRGATVRIRYADIAAVQVEHGCLKIRTTDGHEQFFAVTKAGSLALDRDSTKVAGDLLGSKIHAGT